MDNDGYNITYVSNLHEETTNDPFSLSYKPQMQILTRFGLPLDEWRLCYSATTSFVFKKIIFFTYLTPCDYFSWVKLEGESDRKIKTQANLLKKKVVYDNIQVQ